MTETKGIDAGEHVDVEKKEAVGKVEITLFSDGNVTIHGPIQDPSLMHFIFGQAMIAVYSYQTRASATNKPGEVI